MKDVWLLHVYAIVDGDHKISSLHISQTVGWFADHYKQHGYF